MRCVLNPRICRLQGGWLHPIRGNARLKRKHGVWVLTVGQLLAKYFMDKAIWEIRRRREDLILGKKRSIGDCTQG
jgi:hypothetical protein